MIIMEINVIVRDKIATGDRTRIVCGNSDYIVRFYLDSEWDKFITRTMIVVNGDGTYQEVVFTGDATELPVINNQTGIKIGLYAGDLHTTTPASFDCIKSARCGIGVREEPHEDVYNQLVQLVENGAVKGEKGEKGEDGYTPVKGVDYFDGEDAPQESVLYTEQTLTEDQQEQARTNISAASIDSVYVLKVDLAKLGINYKTSEGRNRCDQSQMVVGLIDRITGLVDESDTTTNTTDFIKIDMTTGNYVTCTMLNSGGTRRINQSNRMAFYDADKNLLYCYASKSEPVEIYAGAVYVRVSLSATSSEYMVEFNDGSFSESVDSYVPYIEGSFESVPLIPTDMLKKSSNIFDGTLFVGRIARTGELDESQTSFYSTDYIYISSMEGYVVPVVKYGNILRNSIAFYDSGKTLISCIYGTYEAPAQIPSNASYVRVSWQNIYYGFFVGVNEDGSLMPYEPYYRYAFSNAVKHMDSWYNGKICACIGDSITAQGKWQGTVADYLGCTMENCGISGSLVSGTTDNAFWQDIRINAPSEKADVVYIMGTTNDGLNNKPIGDATRDNIDTNTVIGAMNVMLAKLLYRYMHIQTYSEVDYSGVNQTKVANNDFLIVIGTPIYCADSRNNMDAYAEAVKDVANMWALPMIDNHNKCRINHATHSIYLSDGVHPNDAGGKFLGECIKNGFISCEPVN